MARRVQILHPVPLGPVPQPEAVVPVGRDLAPVHHGAVDGEHERRLLLVAVAEGRPAVRVPDVGEGVAGVRVQVRHEGVGVVVNDPVGVGDRLEGGGERGVGGLDDGAEGVQFGGGVDGEPVGPEGRVVLVVEVRDEDVGRAGVEEGADEARDLGGDVGGEGGVEGGVVDGEGAPPGGVHVVGAEPHGVESIFVDAASDVVVDLHPSAGGPPAGFAEFAVVEPGSVGETGAEVGLLHRVVDGCAEMASSPSVPESEVLSHGDPEEVGEKGHGNRPVGPGAGAVNRVSVNHVCRIIGCDIVGDATVAVI